MRSDDPAHQGEMPEPLQRHADGLDNIDFWMRQNEKREQRKVRNSRIRARAETKLSTDQTIGNMIASTTAVIVALFFLSFFAALAVKISILWWGFIL